MALSAASSQISIIDTGSTNRAGMTVKVDPTGSATVEPRNAQTQTTTLTSDLCDQLMSDVKAAGTLSELPKQHCPKSVSFGSSLYVEFNGDRSPDISCSPQSDPRAAALQKDANNVLDAVHKQLGISRLRPAHPVKPNQ